MKQRPAYGSTATARRLRSEPTDAEVMMWRLLRESFPEARFRRQVPLLTYFADFASHRSRLIVELDGGQHGGARDIARDAALVQQGYRVLRFWNHDVLGNAAGVHRVIADALGEVSERPRIDGATPTQPSPIKGEGFNADADLQSSPVKQTTS